jgi:metallo-beta-lactamase family protein
MAKRKSEGVRVSFVDSMSAEDVTGSMVYITTPKHKILLDCGMHQTNDKYKDFMTNKRKPKKFKPKDIDLIFISHCHLDHCGLLPLLSKWGCTADVIVGSQNKSVLELMLSDSANINERDILVINSQKNKNYDPLYTGEDVQRAMFMVSQYKPNVKYEVDDELSFELIPSGHLLGAVQIMLYFTVGNVTKTLLYTGDLGNSKIGNPFVGEFQKVKKANCVIGECTYGDKPKLKNTKKDREKDLNKLKAVIDNQVHEAKGRVIIPTFAQSRCQTLAYMIYELYKDEEWQPRVYVDSPLSIKIFSEYSTILDDEDKAKFKEMLTWDRLVFVDSAEDSKYLTESDEPCVILSSSGMCTVGRVKHHIKANLENANATILFVGYATEGSLAYVLKNTKEKAIKIDQKYYVCRCNIQVLTSMSGHAPYKQLKDYYNSINCQKIVLHHGSKEAKETLADDLKECIKNKALTTSVVCSNKALSFSL